MSKVHQLALNKLDGIGYKLGRQLLRYFGDEVAVFSATNRELIEIPGIGKITVEKIRRSNAIEQAEAELSYLSKNNVELIFCTDDKFPRRLHQCVDAPMLLYYKGTADLNTSKILSVVGTRNASSYGLQLCESLAEELKGEDILVISGLAYGIDIGIHKACLKNGISTIGVLGHGVDKIYPSLHTKIADEMLEHGGVLSEFALKTFPDRENFPKRNRVIAGMADAVIVVEAAKKGGALITADIAHSYAKDIFAFPGRTSDPYSEGCNHLIKTNKAALVSHPSDILYYMGWDSKQRKSNLKIQQELPLDLSERELSVYTELKAGNKHIDAIGSITGIVQSQLSPLLLSLELRGLIVCLPGNLYKVV